MNVTTYKEAVKVCMKAGLTLMAWGPGGVGKTFGARQVAEEEKIDFHELTTNTITLDNITGLPYNNNGEMNWSVPVDLPQTGKGLLLIDELTDGMQSVQKQLYRLIYQGEVNGHKLGKDWKITCAGNRPQDGSGSSMLPAPLITRMVHVGVYCEPPNFEKYLPERADTDVDNWIEWAHSVKIRPEVTSYLRTHPNYLYCRQATPRTWEFVSRLLDVITDYSSPILAELLKGTVGPMVGMDFFATIRLIQRIPSPKAIFKNPETAPVPSEIGVVHVLANALIYYLERENFPAIVRYSKRLGREMQVYILTSCIKKDSSLVSVPDFISWRNQNKDIMD